MLEKLASMNHLCYSLLKGVIGNNAERAQDLALALALDLQSSKL